MSRVLAPVEGQHRGSARRSASRQSDTLDQSLDHNFEAELERPVRRQVVAGPRFEPATDSPNGCLSRPDLWITAPKVAGSDQPDLNEGQGLKECMRLPACVERTDEIDSRFRSCDRVITVYTYLSWRGAGDRDTSRDSRGSHSTGTIRRDLGPAERSNGSGADRSTSAMWVRPIGSMCRRPPQPWACGMSSRSIGLSGMDDWRRSSAVATFECPWARSKRT